ncbi:MAG: hypothetical protein MI749_05025 [Desulfovibrionales bacterium]|nr:hypothetical protein [Desulfovibrionales bacterium]
MLVNCYKDADNSFKVYFCDAAQKHETIPATAQLVSTQPIEKWQSSALYKAYNIIGAIQADGVCMVDHNVE